MTTTNVKRLASALLTSFATHALLLGLFLVLIPPTQALPELEVVEEALVLVDPEDVPRELRFDFEEIGPLRIESAADVANDPALPGPDDPRQPGNPPEGASLDLPAGLPRPAGFGPGASVEGGPVGGPPKAATPALAAPFGFRGFGNQDAAGRDQLVKAAGATSASEAAVARGLQWLRRQQSPDGRWLLDGAFPDRGAANDVAGTALGLLPFLGAGKTHQPGPANPYDLTVAKGLRFLLGRQGKRNGEFGGGMYAHGLATLALCEAYGLTQDPLLRRPAQQAVNYLVFAQHEQGGWRYSPGQPGDLSVTGWQLMALKSAALAGLDVPDVTLRKARRFLDRCRDEKTEGYGYLGKQATPTMTAVGLLSRQFGEGWGPRNPRLIRGVNAHLKPTPPGARKDAYYHYYATQVLFHFGGEAWRDWNEAMRGLLIATQEHDRQSPLFGSWSSAGDVWGNERGGRLMVTSLNLLTLEVYYRYLPLYQREAAARMN